MKRKLFGKKIIFFSIIAIYSFYAHANTDIKDLQDTLIESTQKHAFDESPESQNLEQLNPEQLTEEQIQQLRALFLDSLKNTVKTYCEQFDFISEHIAQIVNNGQVRNANTKEALNHFKILRIMTQEIKNSVIASDNIFAIKLSLSLIKTLIEHARLLIKNGLQHFPEPELESVIKRNVEQELDLEKLQQEFIETEQDLRDLDHEAQNVGLSKFNQMYRKVEQFWSDHHLLTRIGQGALLGLGLYAIISRLDEDTYKNVPGLSRIPGLHWLMRTIGSRPLYNRENGYLLNQTDVYNDHFDAQGKPVKGDLIYRAIKWPGYLEHYLRQISIIDLSDMKALITWATISGVVSQQYKNIKTTIDHRWDQLRSYLRGTPAPKRSEFGRQDPKARFKDIIGKDHIKEALQPVIDYIKNPDHHNRTGTIPEAGYILAGPSGTGKSYFAEALAGEIKDALEQIGMAHRFNFFSLNADMVKTLGFSYIVHYAKKNSPCVVFIDEIDMCRLQREGNADQLSEVLTMMSGFMNKDDGTVIFIGATNRPENLDPALLRKGRFGKVVWFDYPTLQDRIDYLKRELENRNIMTISNDYIEKLAHETDHATLEELKSVLISALQKARATGQVLNEKYLERAFDEEIRHVISDDISLSDQQKRILSIHQAGHTLVATLLNGTDHVSKVTIRAVTQKVREEHLFARYADDGKLKQKEQEHIKYGEIFTTKPHHENTIKTYDEMINDIKINLAGHAAEKIVFGSNSFTYHKEDKPKALNIAKSITFEGLEEKDLPKETRNQRNQQAHELLEYCERDVMQLLEEHRSTLINIADNLQQKMTLTATDLQEICKHKEEQYQDNFNDEPEMAY